MYNDSRIKRYWRKVKDFKRSSFERSLIARGWYDLSVRSQDDPIIIGGCGRSGTTLFREILNRHPQIFCGPETSMFGLPFLPTNIAPYWELDEKKLRQVVDASANLVRFAETFYRRQAAEFGKIRWADKTPNNVRAIEKILTWFPKASFIHILRDGRDVACSLRHHPKEKFVKGVLVPLNTNNAISHCAKRWLHDTVKGIAFRSHPRYMEVKYENLVANPEAEIQRVCRFVCEDYSSNMLNTGSTDEKTMNNGRLINNANAAQQITPRSVGRWRKDLNPEERNQFVDVAGELLVVTGYTNDHSWVTDYNPESSAE